MADDGDELLVGVEIVRRRPGVLPAGRSRGRRTNCGCSSGTCQPSTGGCDLSAPSAASAVRTRTARLTWTEHPDEFPDRCVLSARAGRECTRAVGREARPVASLEGSRRLLGDGDIGVARLRDTARGRPGCAAEDTDRDQCRGKPYLPLSEGTRGRGSRLRACLSASEYHPSPNVLLTSNDEVTAGGSWRGHALQRGVDRDRRRGHHG